jgi:hypothetical protein
MAGRPRNRHPDLYSTTEVAETTGLSSRNVIYLCERQELPIVAGGEGSGSHRLLDDEGLARAAVIAALYRAGIGLIAAARVAARAWAEQGLDLRRLGLSFAPTGVPYPAALFADGDHFLDVYDHRFIAMSRKVADLTNGTLRITSQQPLGTLGTEPEAVFTEAEPEQLTDGSQRGASKPDDPTTSPLGSIFASVRGSVESRMMHYQTCLSVNVSMVLRDTKERMDALKAK